MGEQAKHEGLGGFLEWCGEGIIGEHIALQEVIKSQRRLGQNGYGCRCQGEVHLTAIAHIVHTAANGVLGGCCRSGRIFGEDRVNGGAAGVGRQAAAAIEAPTEAEQAGGCDREAIAHQLAVLVIHLQIDGDAGEIDAGIKVFQHEGALEGIARQHGLLVDPDLDSCRHVGLGHSSRCHGDYITDPEEATTTTTTTTTWELRQRAMTIDEEWQRCLPLHRDRLHLVGKEGAVIPEEFTQADAAGGIGIIGNALDV